MTQEHSPLLTLTGPQTIAVGKVYDGVPSGHTVFLQIGNPELAALIVKAVNSHDDLVKALEALVAKIDTWPKTSEHQLLGELWEAQQAIAKAKAVSA